MGLFERYLSVWIGLAIAAGVGLGAWFPDAAARIAALEAAGINLPIAVLIWGMIFPMMLAVDFSSIGAIHQKHRINRLEIERAKLPGMDFEEPKGINSLLKKKAVKRACARGKQKR
jgi:hypothetical protein